MRQNKKTKFDRIKNLAIEDGIHGILYVTGLIPGFPHLWIPIGFILPLIQFLKKRSPLNYVDWQLKDWPLVYRNELNSIVKLLYLGKELYLPQVLLFNNVDRKLRLEKIKLKLIKQTFKIIPEISSVTELAFKRLWKKLMRIPEYANSQNLRLVDIIDRNDSIDLLVQSVDFKHYVHTNLVMDARIKGKVGTLRGRLHRDGRLDKLNDSPLSNLLGINILLFSADGSLIIQKRSKKVAIRRGELGPSASGALSAIDVLNQINLIRMPKLREAIEEVGIKQEDVPENQMFFLGMTRDLITGGTPEMFFCANTILSEEEIKSRWKYASHKWESQKFIFFNIESSTFGRLNNNGKRHEFLCEVDEFLNKYIHIASIPLLTNIALWLRYRLKDK